MTMAAHENDYLFSSIPQSDGARYRDDNGRPVYGGRYMDVKNGAYVQGTDAASQDEARYRALGEQQSTAPWIDREQSDQARDLSMQSRDQGLQAREHQLGSLGYLDSAAAGNTDDQAALRYGAYGQTDDTMRLGDAAAGRTHDMQLLQGAAEGTSPSRAEILGHQMSDRALKAQVSAAGNVRGGPGASAAAFRATSQSAALQRADMNLGIQAGRADEMAQARGAYSNAMGGARTAYGNQMSGARRDYSNLAQGARRDAMTGANDLRIGDSNQRGQDLSMRNQDIGQATSQAQLIAQQQEADRANQRYYEGLDNSTKFGVLSSQTGSEDAWRKQQADSRAMHTAEEQAGFNRAKDVAGGVGAVGSGALGAAQAYQSFSGGSSAPASSGGGIVRSDPYSSGDTSYYDPSSGINRGDPYSDVKTKEPVSWGSLAPIAFDGQQKPDNGAPADQGASYRDTMTSDQAAKEKVAATAFAQGVKAGAAPSRPGGVQSFGTHDSVAPRRDQADKAIAVKRNEARAENADAADGYASMVSATGGYPALAVPAAAAAGLHGIKASMAESRADDLQREKLKSEMKDMTLGEDEGSQKFMNASFAEPLSSAEMNRPAPHAFERPEVTYSDERTKEGFSEIPDEQMADAMRTMGARPYRYKSEFVAQSGQKPGEVNVGPMANDMAKNPVASTAIVRDKDSGLLAIDKDKGLKMVMGSLATLQHQIDGIRSTEPGKARYRGGSPQP